MGNISTMVHMIASCLLFCHLQSQNANSHIQRMEVNKVQLNSCNFNKTKKKKHMITNREEEDDIELSLQSYEAQRIDYYDENGKEIYAR